MTMNPLRRIRKGLTLVKENIILGTGCCRRLEYVEIEHQITNKSVVSLDGQRESETSFLGRHCRGLSKLHHSVRVVAGSDNDVHL